MQSPKTNERMVRPAKAIRDTDTCPPTSPNGSYRVLKLFYLRGIRPVVFWGQQLLYGLGTVEGKIRFWELLCGDPFCLIGPDGKLELVDLHTVRQFDLVDG